MQNIIISQMKQKQLNNVEVDIYTSNVCQANEMFANAFQSGFLTLFYSLGSNPLSIWDKTVKNGHIRRIVDEEVKSLVLEIAGTNVATTYITCPIKPRISLGVRLPFLVMVVKNLKKYFTFEIQILDDKDMRRRFRVSNFQSTTKVRPFCTTMPIGLSGGWNQIQFNLADFTKRAYGTTYVETVRVQIHANIRLRRIYFSNRLYSEDELPNEYKMFLPGSIAKKSAATASKTKQETLVDTAKSMEVEEPEKGQGEEPEPAAAPPSPVEDDQAQPTPVEPSEAAPPTEVTAGDASASPEGEAPMEVPVEGAEEGAKITVEGSPTGVEGQPAEEAKSAGEVEGEAAPTEAQPAEGEPEAGPPAETAPEAPPPGEGEVTEVPPVEPEPGAEAEAAPAE